MNRQSLTFAGFAFAALVFVACGDDSKTSGGSVEDQEVIAISDKTISGVSQKGPFVNGSSVTVQELNGETLAQTGDSYEGKIKNDLGEFSVKVTKLASQYALLKANGFYRNEVTGEKSKSQVTLYALTDLSDRDEVNVNLLTHLAYERSLYLATSKDSLSVSGAKKKAETEVLKTFGIEGDFAAAEDLNIFGENDQSAALLAVSVLMQGSLSEGDFSERLANYAADIESDGVWNDSQTATKIADWANSQGLGSGLVKIRENITKWELSADVPAFEKYVNNFWWQNYGLGICDKKRESEVLKNQNSASENADEYYICKSSSWQVASDLEKNTYKWATGKDAEVKYGDVVKENCYVFEDKTWRAGNKLDCSLELQGCTKLRQDTVGKGSDKVWHICDDKSWRDATTFEKDTFGWKNSTDGVIKKGNVTDTIYVFDKTKWRVTSNVEAKLGGCVSAIADSVGKVESIYYICKSGKWVDASALEYDTYKWTAGKDGDSKLGSVNTKNCYVYEDNSWRSGNANDCTLDLRGCTTLRQDAVGKGSDKVWYTCDSKSWREAIDIEKDTATWGAGSFDGEVRAGQVNKTIYYIYETGDKSWRNASTLEKDTYDYKNNKDWVDGADGQIQKGSVTDTIYVFDKAVWRVADGIESVLGGCVAAISDSVGKAGSSYYICTPREWKTATALQYDTYKRECSKNGELFNGNVNTSIRYVCEADSFRLADSLELLADLGCTNYNQGAYSIPAKQYSYYKCVGGQWNYTIEKLNQGTMTDSRDGRVYKTIGIKSQLWMAENLNYADSLSYPSMLGKNSCYYNKPDSCQKYGRFYTWSAVIDSIYWVKEGKKCGYGFETSSCGLPNVVQGICPEGWHIPSSTEAEILIHETPYSVKLKWWYGAGSDKMIWTSTEHLSDYVSLKRWDDAEILIFAQDDWNGEFMDMGFTYSGKEGGFAVRCLKD